MGVVPPLAQQVSVLAHVAIDDLILLLRRERGGRSAAGEILQRHASHRLVLANMQGLGLGSEKKLKREDEQHSLFVTAANAGRNRIFSFRRPGLRTPRASLRGDATPQSRKNGELLGKSEAIVLAPKQTKQIFVYFVAPFDNRQSLF
jgi:hypothetical protein